ncbi:hypothetical protein ACQ86K_12770 [Mucilaginibacter sp. P19]|uniref:DUF4433 domain-containing protein n=1 Tax=Mucilaginibacter gossypii TaxID=551996 RepID=A0A1G8D2L1_9SPHI|nr:hypothetical protein [Mucilaginibacter gossypii]SDH52077.1 hypothetical protein SAMN05192573_110108 [Mucilaginibacter gossypii]
MIEDYALISKELFQVLQKKNVTYLYHANTVATSLTFIRAKALLSRFQVEADGLAQTSQTSDQKDKDHDVWDHLYLDGQDHHKEYSRANHYGPVVFIFKIELLNEDEFKQVYVMRSNPATWDENTTEVEKFYNDIDEVERDYKTNTKLDSQIMFTFRHQAYNLNLEKYLFAIGIDEPIIAVKVESGVQIGKRVNIRAIMKQAMEKNGLVDLPLLRRHNKVLHGCQCFFQYNYMYNFNKSKFLKLFDPKYV